MKKLFAASLVFLIAIACKKQENPEGGNVLARIGDIVITDRDISLALQGLPINISGEQQEAIKEELVRIAVFYLEAMKERYDTIDELNRRIEWMKRNLVAQEYLKRKYGDRRITPEQAKDFIRKNVSKFSKKANFILVMYFDSTLTDELKDLLEDTSPFARKKLGEYMEKGMINVQPFSQANLGILSLDFPQEILDALLKANPKSVLGPFRMQNAFVLIKLESISEDDPQRPEIVQNVVAFLQIRDQQLFMDSLYNVLKQKYIR